MTEAKFVEVGFLEGHAARFKHALDASHRSDEQIPNSIRATIHAETATTDRRKWTWAMIANENIAYDKFRSGIGQKRRGFGLQAFASSRTPPYVKSTLRSKLLLNDQRKAVGVSPTALDKAGIAVTFDELQAYANKSVLCHMLSSCQRCIGMMCMNRPGVGKK